MTRVVALVAYLTTIVAANWAVETFGLIPVGFGLFAPAAVVFAGLAFTLRDLVHETGGWRWVLAGVAAGCALSFVVASPALALASAAAFGVSELADWATYTLLRARRLVAVAVSNAVGLVVDSLIFLAVAFGSLAYLPGQVVGKAWITAATLAALAAARMARPARRAEA